jgi:prepilin-type N-terminal cleavage/methylation domain-containing protein
MPAGFTLAELLVGVIVLSLVTGATTAAVARLARARSGAIAQHQAQSRAHRAAAMIASDVARVARDHDLIHARVLVTDEREANRDVDELLLIIRSLQPVRGLFGVPEGADFEVQYRVDESGEGGIASERNVLWRRVDPSLDEYQDAGGVATPLLEGVVALSLEAHRGPDEDWEEEWDSDIDGYPYGVRIVVTATDDEGRREAVARRVVAIDRVPLPPLSTDAEVTTTTTTTSGESGAGGGIGGSGDTGGANAGGGGR